MTTTTLVPERDPTRLSVHSRLIDPVGDPLALLPTARDALSWMRGGEGLVGWGEALRIETRGPHRFASADAQWRQLADRVAVRDEVGLPGSGLVAFASFAFGDRPGRSVLIVPRVVVGQRAGRCWITEVGEGLLEALQPSGPASSGHTVRWRDGFLPSQRWQEAVAEAVRRLRGGQLDKVVLARDVLAEAREPIDARAVLRRLAARYADCWTFAVQGLVGATPELLLRRHRGQVCSQVLAGTSWPGAEAPEESLRSATHREEHRLAVESLVAPLVPHCSSLRASGPSVLRLPNIAHLATDVRGVLSGPRPSSLLRLTAAVHPTAAVGGTPRTEAARVIAELEGEAGLDRGRYAAPVGWVDGHGDGELGLALRCAQLTGRYARLFAGCGLVAGSEPEAEVRETHAKFAAMRDALAT